MLLKTPNVVLLSKQLVGNFKTEITIKATLNEKVVVVVRVGKGGRGDGRLFFLQKNNIFGHSVSTILLLIDGANY